MLHTKDISSLVGAGRGRRTYVAYVTLSYVELTSVSPTGFDLANCDYTH
jgi:hypothetical protein